MTRAYSCGYRLDDLVSGELFVVSYRWSYGELDYALVHHLTPGSGKVNSLSSRLDLAHENEEPILVSPQLQAPDGWLSHSQ